MNRFKTGLIVVSIIALAQLTGCASPNMKLSQPVAAVAQAPQDKALVTFIRPSRLGFAISAAVYDDEKFIGFVPYQTRLDYLAEPGEHIFMVVSEAADFMKADLLAGKQYYVKVVPRMGAWRARFSILPVHKGDLSSEQVQQWISEAQPVQNIDEAYTWAEENQPSVLKKKEVYFEKWMKKEESARPYLMAEDGK